jgi:hypothetical protein
MNVSLAVGSVHHPEAFAFQIQNLTAQTFGVELAAGEALTLPYSFFLSPQLGGGPNPRYTRACPAHNGNSGTDLTCALLLFWLHSLDTRSGGGRVLQRRERARVRGRGVQPHGGGV